MDYSSFRSKLFSLRYYLLKLVPEASYLYKFIALRGMRIMAKSFRKKRTKLRICISVVEHCNLHCKYCTSYAPIAEESYYEIDKFKKDMARLAELTGNSLELILFSGGEPLLHPKLAEMFDIAREFFPDTPLNLITNGLLLLSKDENFYQSLHRNQVYIDISRYPIKLDIEKIFALIDKYEVNCGYLDRGKSVVKKMWKYPLDLSGKQTRKNSFDLCTMINYSSVFLDGKIFPCHPTQRIYHFNRYFNQELRVEESDFIDIYKIDNIDEVFEFLMTPKPFCRFCNRKGITFGHTYEKSNKDISEWT